jgi:MscS family membrane protein
LDRIHFLKENELLGQKLWKYVASLIYILLAFFVSKLLDYVVNAWLKKWTARTKTRLDDLLLELLHGPVKVVTFVIFLHIGLDVFGWGIVAQTYLSKGLIIVVACSLTYVALKVIDLLMGLWRQRTATGADKGFDGRIQQICRFGAEYSGCPLVERHGRKIVSGRHAGIEPGREGTV